VLVPYLEAERAGALLPPRPARETDILIFIIETRELVEVIVDLDLMKETSSCVVKEHHAPLDRDELNAARDLMVQAPEVKAAIAELELPEGTIVVPQVWPAGADDDKPSERKVFYTLYHRNPENNSPDSNHWGYPLPLVVWWDLWENKVTSITYCYTGAEEDGRRLRTGPKTNPTKGYKSAEFFPELRGGSTRDDLKPLHVNQPEGPSFTVDGQLIQWQKWRFRVSFK
jgi:primary-amine oxidase